MGTITRTFANNITTGGKFDATDFMGNWYEDRILT